MSTDDIFPTLYRRVPRSCVHLWNEVSLSIFRHYEYAHEQDDPKLIEDALLQILALPRRVFLVRNGVSSASSIKNRLQALGRDLRAHLIDQPQERQEPKSTVSKVVRLVKDGFITRSVRTLFNAPLIDIENPGSREFEQLLTLHPQRTDVIPPPI